MGAERVTLGNDRLPRLKVNGKPYLHIHRFTDVPEVSLGWFGNPTVRAVSKLCASIMQITLKVKSAGTI